MTFLASEVEREIKILAEGIRQKLQRKLGSSITVGETTFFILPPFEARQGLPSLPTQFGAIFPIWWETPKGLFEMPFDMSYFKLKNITDEEIGALSQILKREWRKTHEKVKV